MIGQRCSATGASSATLPGSALPAAAGYQTKVSSSRGSPVVSDALV